MGINKRDKTAKRGAKQIIQRRAASTGGVGYPGDEQDTLPPHPATQAKSSWWSNLLLRFARWF